MYLKANLEFGKRTVSKRRQLTMSCSIFVASFFHRFLKMLEFSLETASGTMPNFSAYFGSSYCTFETICQSVVLKYTKKSKFHERILSAFQNTDHPYLRNGHIAKTICIEVVAVELKISSKYRSCHGSSPRWVFKDLKRRVGMLSTHGPTDHISGLAHS